MNGWEDGFHNNNHHNAILLLLLLLRHVISRATILTIRYVRFWAEPSHTKEGVRGGNGSREVALLFWPRKFRENTLVELL